MHQTKAYFPTNRVIKQLFLFFTHAHKPKFWLHLRIYFDLSLSFSFFLCLSCILSVFCPLYRLFFCIELWLANFLGKEKRVADKPPHWQWIFPQNVTFSVSVTLLGLVRISKTRYCQKLFVTLLLTNLLTYINWKLHGSRKENMHNHASFDTEWQLPTWSSKV